MWKPLIKFKNLISHSRRSSQLSQPSDFTLRSQQLLQSARQEAMRLNHCFVGTEHMVLGIIRLGRGTAFNVLVEAGLDFEAIKLKVEELTSSGPATTPVGMAIYTPRLKKVIALAQKEAKALDHDCVGTGHILLALLLEEDGVGARVLRGFGFDLDLGRPLILGKFNTKYEAEYTGF